MIKTLLKKSIDSATHSVESEDIRVTKHGFFTKSPEITHSENDHPEMKLKGWYELVRNTAIRSFSQEGVD